MSNKITIIDYGMGNLYSVCNAIAAVVPLLFIRPIITIAEFFRKPGETQP